MRHRIVVTGVGVVTPVGGDRETFWGSLLAGRSGVGRITQFDASEYASQIAAEIPEFDPTEFMTPKDAKHTDRYAQIAVAAAKAYSWLFALITSAAVAACTSAM